jgi:hypothetical protein
MPTAAAVFPGVGGICTSGNRHLATEIGSIKAEPGPDVVVWGGGRFAGALAAVDLIDE